MTPFKLRCWSFCLFGFVVQLVAVGMQSISREWSDPSGKFRVQAELVSVRGDKVILEKSDGSIISVPIEKLCQADRDFLKNNARPKTTPDLISPADRSEKSPTASSPEIRVPPSIEHGKLAERTSDIFKKACYRCHGEDGSSEGGFNFVVNLEKLSRTLAKPKDLSGSQLLKRLVAKDDGIMPPIGEDPRPSADELATINAWVEAGSPAIPVQTNREFITNEQIVNAIHADVLKQTDRKRRFMRYFTLTHLHNAGVSEDELQTYRNAFTKLINSLSWNTDLLTPRPIDESRTIMAIDIRDLHWNVDMWKSIEQANPYFLQLTSAPAISCAEDTQTEMPYVRIDWLVFAASKPPLYHVLLNLPESDFELEDLLRVNVKANIEQEKAIRAAFNRSGVSQNNRLIEWHKSPYGSYWKSYDFGGSAGRQNLFQHPMGPGKDDQSFKHDGGEIIFSLPNGLQGYLLVDASGKRIDQGPVSIVSDPKRPDKTVTNGVSCMSCHYTGIIPKKDEVGGAVRANLGAFAESADILAIYRQPSELDEVFSKEGNRFAKALQQIGISSLSRSGEPISAMAARFDEEIDLPQVACEFGLSGPEFQERLSKATKVARAFSSLLVPGGTIKRDVFKAMFAEAALDLRLVLEANMKSSNRSTGTDLSRPSLNIPRSKTEKKESDSPEVVRFSDLNWGVSSLAFSPNGNFIAAGKPDRAILLFDIPNKAKAGSLETLEALQKVSKCAFTPDGKRLIAGGSSGHVIVFSVSPEGMLKEVSQFAGHSNDISSLAISVDGKFAMSGGQDKKACFWEIESGIEIATIPGFAGEVKAVYISRNGKEIQATDGATLIEYDPKRKDVKRRRTLTKSWASGQSATFSPDGDMLAVGDSYNIRLWNVQTGRELQPLVGNEIQWTMQFTPDGSRLLSGGNAKVNVWDTKKFQRIHVQSTSGSGYVQSLAISGDGKFFAAPGSARDLQVFHLSK